MVNDFNNLLATIEKQPWMLANYEPFVYYNDVRFCGEFTCEQYQQLCLTAIRSSSKSVLPTINVNRVVDYRELCNESLEITNSTMSDTDFNHFIRVYGEVGLNAFLMKHAKAIGYMDQKYVTDELRMEAIKQDPIALSHIPVEYQTVELCYVAMQGDPHVVKYMLIPYELVINYPKEKIAELLEN
jgi:hypothetical protein